MDQSALHIDATLAKKLVKTQFPQWSDLAIRPVQFSGHDNHTFHLGEQLSIRMPSGPAYAAAVEKEQQWLPRLAAHLPLTIPSPIALGKPSPLYPWPWSICQWLPGETATEKNILEIDQFAQNMAIFLNTLQRCDTTGGPMAGADNFYRGSTLNTYDHDTRKAIAHLTDPSTQTIYTAIWEQALASTWENSPVWIHGDMAANNLLVNHGKLSAVIDFGQMALGDPACDLAIYWTFLSANKHSQQLFRQTIDLDEDTWHRGRGWVLWKTLCAPIKGTDCDRIFQTIVADFNQSKKH